MANPINEIKAAARIVAGIAGKGGKDVKPVYRSATNDVAIIGDSREANIRQAQQILRRGKEEGAIGKLPTDNRKANARGLKAANAPAKRKAPAVNVMERAAAKNVGNKIAKNYPNKLRKDAMSMGAQIVQKEGPSVSRTAGKGSGSAKRYQLNSDTMGSINPVKKRSK